MLKHLSIALPLFIAVLNIVTPAGAEQIGGVAARKEHRVYRVSTGVAKSKNLEAIPSVTNLNLMVPVSAREIAPDNDGVADLERREQSNSIEPIWSDSSRNNRFRKAEATPTKPAIDKQSVNKTKLRLRSATTSNIKSPISLTSERSHQPKSVSRTKNLVAINVSSATTATSKPSNKLKSTSRQRIATRLPSPLSGNYLRLVKDPNKGNNARGNPLYTLEAYVDGQIHRTFNAVSGTRKSQNADRNLGDNVAPLPDGLYTVSNQIIPSNVPEIGKTFISIFPKFETGRDELGIHLDPSFNKDNGYDGTAGCIGITTPADLNAVNEFVTKYRPRNLLVKIVPS
jgi:hypothetical protein